MQRGNVAMLKEHSTTLRVANGMERIERDDPQVDVEELAERLDETIKSASKKSPSEWLPYIGMGVEAIKGMAQAFHSFQGGKSQPEAKSSPPRPEPSRPEPTPAASDPEADDVDEFECESDVDEEFEDITETEIERPQMEVCETAPPWYSTTPEPVSRDAESPAIELEQTEDQDCSTEKNASAADHGTRPGRVATESAGDEPAPLEAPKMHESPPVLTDRHEPPLLE